MGGPNIIFHRFHEKDVTQLRHYEYGERSHPFKKIVGYDANALYLWALTQDMPTVWYTHRSEENSFRYEHANRYGHMAEEWLSWETARTEKFIRHQSNGHDKRIGKLLVDGWCAETRTTYQFHGCFFHGCPCNEKEVNDVKGVPISVLLEDTRNNTAYLRKFVEVVEMWECDWKRIKKETEVKAVLYQPLMPGYCSDSSNATFTFPRDHFAEMQPVFKNINITRQDIGPFMRSYAEEHDIIKQPQCSLVGSYRGDKILLATPLLKWYMDHGLVVTRVYRVIQYE